MDLLTLIKERRSVRQFLKEPIPREDLEEILEAAQWAPSGGNKQGWKFIVIKNPDLLDEMSKMVGDKIDKLAEEAGLGNKLKGNKVMATFFNQAPVTIAVFMERYISKIEEALEGLGYQPLEIQRLRGQSDLQSIGAAIQNILLMAHSKGYGSCWLCSPNIASPEIEKLLGVAENWQLKALVPIGKPARDYKAPVRKDLTEIVEYRD